jgi:hypothetical protein
VLHEPLWEAERLLIEALLERYDKSTENGGTLFEINAATRHLGLDHSERTRSWGRLMGRELLTTEEIGCEVEWDRTTRLWAYRLDLERARQALAPPKPPGPRQRLSSLAARL